MDKQRNIRLFTPFFVLSGGVIVLLSLIVDFLHYNFFFFKGGDGFLFFSLSLFTFVIIFYFSKKAVQAEKLNKPKFVDHFRQCSLLYLWGVFAFQLYFFHFSKVFIGIANMSFVIIISAIVANILFLSYWRYQNAKK